MKKQILILAFALFFLALVLLPVNNYAQRGGKPFLKDEALFLKFSWLFDLTEEQKSKLEELRKKWIEQRWDFQDEMKRLRFKLRELLKDPQADEKEIENIIDEISKLRAEHFKRMLKHRKEIRAILNPEQLDKLEKFKRILFRKRMLQNRRFSRGERFFRPGFESHRPFHLFRRDRIF